MREYDCSSFSFHEKRKRSKKKSVMAPQFLRRGGNKKECRIFLEFKKFSLCENPFHPHAALRQARRSPFPFLWQGNGRQARVHEASEPHKLRVGLGKSFFLTRTTLPPLRGPPPLTQGRHTFVHRFSFSLRPAELLKKARPREKRLSALFFMWKFLSETDP